MANSKSSVCKMNSFLFYLTSWQLFNLKWNGDWNCCLRLKKCFSASAVWMGEFARFHSECTTLTFNISWKCCTSTVLFELSESLNKVFNSCIDFSTTVKTSQSYFFGVWLLSSAALGLVDIIVLPDAEPRVLSAFVSPKTVMSQL